MSSASSSSSASCVDVAEFSSLVEKAEQLEDYVAELRRQRDALQLVDTWTSEYDYADFLETVSLIDLHIGLAVKELRCVRDELSRRGFPFS